MANSSEMNNNLEKQLEYVVAGIARNNLTVKEFALKDFHLLLLKKANNFVHDNRWQRELGEELKKRTHACMPYCVVS